MPAPRSRYDWPDIESSPPEIVGLPSHELAAAKPVPEPEPAPEQTAEPAAEPVPEPIPEQEICAACGLVKGSPDCCKPKAE